mgnify:CR=1 FL=1
MSPDVLLILLLLIVGLEATVQTVAEFLQVGHQPTTLPTTLQGAVDDADYDRARAYARARVRLTSASRAATLVVTLIAFISGVLADGYALVASWTGGGWWTPLLFLALVGLAMDLLTLPFSLYATFGIEERFGFNRTTPALFLRDKLVGYGVTVVLGGGLLALLVASIDAWGRDFWIPYAILVGTVVTLLAAFQTSVLLPLFNKLTPLGEGPLRDAIDRYVENSDFELDDVYVMDGSKRSTKANAFFSGLGRTRKVVLFDTLIEKHGVDATLAVVAHEVGHAVHRHVPKFLIGNLATIVLMLFALSRVVDSAAASRALGAPEAVLALNLIVFAVLFGPLGTLIGVVVNAFSRRFEYQADAFAARTTSPEAMATALRSFMKDELSLPVAHPFYAALNLSHPAPVDRIRAIETRT